MAQTKVYMNSPFIKLAFSLYKLSTFTILSGGENIYSLFNISVLLL